MKLQLGNPALLNIIYDVDDMPKGTDKFVIDFRPSKECFDKILLKDEIIKSLKPFKDGYLCLSGGYDSQFIALLMKEAGYNFKAKIYESVWGMNVINSNDLLFSEKFCKKHNFKYDIVSIDSENFFTNDLMIPMVKEFRSASPQILFHIYFLQQMSLNNILMGGDIPYITYDQNTKKSYLENLIAYINQYVSPYLIYADVNKTKLLKNILHHTPDIFIQSLLLNIEILKNHKVYQPRSGNIVYENYRYKEIFYNELLEIPLEHRLMCATGFENLKKHFASVSGQYDKFDVLYREPLKKIKARNKMSTYNTNQNYMLSMKTQNNFTPEVILDEYNSVFEEVKPTPLKDYLFDF